MAGLSIIFKAIDEISSKFDSIATCGSKAVERFDELGAAADKAYTEMADAAFGASDALEKAVQSTDQWTDAIANYDKNAMEAIYSTEELVEMGFKTEDALQDAAKAADEAAAEFGKLGEQSEEAAKKSEGFGDKSTNAVNALSNVLATVGIAAALTGIAAAFMACSTAAAEFETNIAMVSTVADSSVLSSGQLSEQISNLSTEVAQSVNELADATYNAISASVDTANAAAFVGTSNKLAVGGFTESAVAVDVLTTAINAYGMEATDATKISDYLITTQNLGKTTVDQLASSVGMVIPTAAAYGVELDNLSTAYAVLTANGVATAQATTYLKSMMTELADSGSGVSKVLQEETGNTFSELMAQGDSLGDVMQILGDNVDGNSTAFSNLWSSTEAATGALSMYNSGADKFTSVLGQMQNSAGAAEKAYKTMTDTTEYSTKRMENSFDNLGIAIGDDLNPVVGTFQNEISDVVDSFTKLVVKHPAISAVLTGIFMGLGALTIGVTVYTVATTVAIPAIVAFGTAINVSIWPLTLLVGAIAAAAASIIYFSNKMEEANNVQENLVTSSRNMEDELNSLQEQYNETIEIYGRNSDEAYKLKMEIDELSESFVSSKRTIGDLASEIESLSTTLDEIHKTYEDAITSNGELEYSSRVMTEQLAILSSKSTNTDSDLMLMQGIVDSLNISYEGLNITLDETSGKLNLSIEQLYSAVEQAADDANNQAATKGLVDTLQSYNQLKDEMDTAFSETIAAKEKYNELEEGWINDHPVLSSIGEGAEMNWSDTLGEAWNEWQKLGDEAGKARSKYDECIGSITEYCEELGYTGEETKKFIETLKSSSDAAREMDNSLSSTSESMVSSEDAVATAIAGVKDEIESLATKYDEAFAAARTSIDGQIGLFDTMKTKSEISVADMQKAFESQLEYLNTYTANLEKASSLGLNEGLISSLSDGSAESAGQLDAIIAKIEKLGGTSDDAKAFVEKFNSQFEQVDAAKDTFSGTVADMEKDFTAGMDIIGKELEDAIDKMNMSEDAAKAARSTMDAYIEAIKSKTNEVNSAVAAFDFVQKNPVTYSNATKEKGYAVGTADAEPGIALVGENGPELVNFGGGETVYTAGETMNILANNVGNSDFYVAPPAAEEETESGTQEKIITLRIEGSGDMKIGSNMNKDDVLGILMDNVKGALMNIVHQEILEEGDMSYEF